MLRDPTDSITADPGGAAVGHDVGEERDDQEGLLGRVEEVDEKVAVDVPAVQLLGRRLLALELGRARVDDEAVVPAVGLGRHALLAAAQLADGRPRSRRVLADLHLPVLGHVGAFADPRALVVRVEAQPRPDVLRPFGRLLGCEGLLQHQEAVLHERVDLRLRQHRVGLGRGDHVGGCYGGRLVWGSKLLFFWGPTRSSHGRWTTAFGHGRAVYVWFEHACE